MEEAQIRDLIERHARLFRLGLGGDAGEDTMEAEAVLFTDTFIAASPAGVRIGRNGPELGQTVAQGFEYQRAIGTTDMRMRDLRITPIDAHHCIAHVAWTATYAREDLAETAVDFDVHYLVQKLDGPPRIFGWIAGDEEALLRERGII